MVINKEIIIYAQGGLGNQLFQYGFARYLEIEKKKIVKFDTTFFKNNFRTFKLNQFKTYLQIANKYEIQNSKYQRSNIFPWKIKSSVYVEDSYFNFDFPIEKIDNGYCIGYWPKTEHLHKIIDELKDEIKIIDEIKDDSFFEYLNLIRNSESVGIHIRRGDYLNKENKKLFTTLDETYYIKAVNYINTHVNNCHYYIFSDDINWVKSQKWFNTIKYTLVSFKDNDADLKEFELLKSCKHHIIANSTFSWWAAFLNYNDSYINICPSLWYNNEEYQKLYKNNKILNANFIKM